MSDPPPTQGMFGDDINGTPISVMSSRKDAPALPAPVYSPDVFAAQPQMPQQPAYERKHKKKHKKPKKHKKHKNKHVTFAPGTYEGYQQQPLAPPPAPPRKGARLLAWASEHLRVLAVFAILLAALVYGLPRVAAMPYLSAAGQPTVAGLGALAAAGAGAFAVVDAFAD